MKKPELSEGARILGALFAPLRRHRDDPAAATERARELIATAYKPLSVADVSDMRRDGE